MDLNAPGRCPGRSGLRQAGVMTDRQPGTDDAVPTLSAALGPVLAIDHVGVAVADLDAAIAFYGATFGLREVHRETNTEQQIVEAMLAPGPQAQDLDRHSRPAQLQLLAPLSQESAIAAFLERSGPGLQQLAFRVADLAAASNRLRSAGLRLLYPEPRHGTAGSMINFVHPRDAGGVLVELVQPAS